MYNVVSEHFILACNYMLQLWLGTLTVWMKRKICKNIYLEPTPQ